jgi:hypothetical protein
VWKSEKEWGSYFFCTTDNVEANQCTVYYPDGEIRTCGRYRLAGYYRAATKEELKYTFLDSEGIIYLADNKKLEPISKSIQQGIGDAHNK